MYGYDHLVSNEQVTESICCEVHLLGNSNN